MSIAVKVTGTKEVMAALEKIGDAFDNKLEAAVLSGCFIVQNDAKRKCRYLTGDTRSSIHTGDYGGMSDLARSKTGTDIGGKVVTDRRVELLVGTNAENAKRLEYGTEPHIIVPKDKKALFWKGAEHPVKKVHHPGTRPYPFLRPAFDENRKKVVAEICSALKEVLK